MTLLRITPALAFGALGIGLLGPATARAQVNGTTTETTKSQPSRDSQGFASRDALHAYYEKQLAELDRRRIVDLTQLAAKQHGPEAEATYSELFQLAVARDEYNDAEKAAQDYIESNRGDSALLALATYIQAIAQADRGKFDQSLQGLERFLKGSQADRKLDPQTITGVGEAFLQHAIRSGRYDVARQVGDLFIANHNDPTIKEHFTSRLTRIDMLGKFAPDIEGTDVDGQKVSLSGLKGKVVLVDFWATWCPPCVAEIPNLNALVSKYGEKDFAIVGINLDAMREDVREATRALPVVRRFLVNYRVAWPSILNGKGANDYTRAYGVTEIPSNFLIDRNGKIIQVELSGSTLQKAVAEAIGGEKEKVEKATQSRK
jgi:thiol-disulfide isomerase/thioredoxin